MASTKDDITGRFLSENISKEEFFWKHRGLDTIKTFFINEKEDLKRVFSEFHRITKHRFCSPDQRFQVGTYSSGKSYIFECYIREVDYVHGFNSYNIDNIFMIKIMPIKTMNPKEIRSLVIRKYKKLKYYV
ncbi:HT motif family protein [Fowlpox virus]|uniref:ORF FPV209 HT motif gene family protein n=2 Tax=Fowlpox virus TaxID=10261 RepID=Q9J526_FOWPN|nr:HT motif gene family protein [Fowlpox virus]UNS14442.1 ALPV-278 [Albatrosspox virus]WPD91057.1 HT motif family protein [Avipoxvirus sp.]CAE52747.1 hypothetical protein [Fowlpox virus isolate HP-438/Munich]AAF44553.1 ORF FPV209 HT motif gene family protein [Fowlpox virus]ART91642.1 HT motif family protein [Fowlpox virus]